VGADKKSSPLDNIRPREIHVGRAVPAGPRLRASLWPANLSGLSL